MPDTPGIITYRHLPPEEWERLREAYAQQGSPLPSSDCKSAIVAELNGKVIGLTGIDYVVHTGPRWVHPRWRRMGVALKMGRLVDEVLKDNGATGYLMFPSNPAACALAERLGLEKLDWSVYKREF